MSIPLALLKKVRCRFLCLDSGSPVSGVVASLTVGLGDPPNLTRIPLGTLCSDTTGYVSFDLKALIDRGVVSADSLLLTTPMLQNGEVELLDILLKDSGDKHSDTTASHRLSAINVVGPAAPHGQPDGVSQDPGFCLVFPVYLSNSKCKDDKHAASSCSATSLPAIQAPDACDYRASPFSFVTPVNATLGDGCCETLVPSSLPLQEHRFYKVVVRREDKNEISGVLRKHTGTPTISEVKVTDPLVTRTPKLKYAEVIEFKQQWRSLGHSLGEIKYSLALAPGEATQIAIIDWTRQDNISRVDSVVATEYMDHSLKRDRSIEETIDSALSESQGGSSFMAGTSGQATIPLQYVTLSFNHAIGGSISNSWGNRNLEANSLQDLHDGIRQQSAYTRSLNSTVVIQASQAEQNVLQTRKVANHNHCHALTIQYYEVLRHFQMRTEYTGRKKALLVPFEPFVFTWDLALRFRSILESALIDPSLKGCFDAIFRLKVVPTIYDAKPDVNTAGASSTETIPSQPKTVAKTMNVKGVEGEGVGSSVYVKNGDDLRIEASGELTMSWLGWTKGPNGDTDLAEARSTFLAPGLRKYSLIYKIGIEGAWRQAGTIAQETADRNGEIVFGVNDTKNDFADNKGGGHDYWTVTVTVPSHETEAPAPANPTPATGNVAAPTGGEVFTRERDELCVAKLITHLNGNQGYYNSCVWVLQSPVERRIRLESALAGHPDVLDALDDTPIAVSGNHVAFLYDGPFPGWQDSRPDDPQAPLEDIVTLPTRGLFAEAQLGHCNACEERDPTRMWDWKEMTIETPPDIGGVTPGPKGQTPTVTPTPLPGNVIQITQPPSAPDPTGLAAALKVLGTPNIFRDMSGLDEVSKLLETLSKESSEANIKALAQQAKDKLDQAKSNTGSASNTDKARSSASESDAAKQVDRLKAIEYAKGKNMIDDQGAQGATKGVLGGEQIVLASTTRSVEKMIGSGDFLLKGIDVSHHQQLIDWQQVKSNDVSFAFIKATEGATEDGRFQFNWKESQNVGLIVGAYHYFRAATATDKQSDSFFKAVGTRHPPQLPPAVDVETIGNDLTALGITPAEFVVRLKAFCDAIEGFYGIRPIIYTSAAEWKSLTDDSDEFADYPLWIANVARNDTLAGGVVDQPGNAIPDAPVEPLVPPAWHGGWYFWQYSWKGRIDGIVPFVDLDLFNGNFTDLTRFAGFKVTYEA